MSNGDSESGDVNVGGGTDSVSMSVSSQETPVVVSTDQGPPGVRGNSVLNGTVNPTAAIGIDGDFYINTLTYLIWGPKISGAWPAKGVPLQGPQGPPGAGLQGPPGQNGNTLLSGTGAPANTLGNDGDFYLDTAASVMYGPKASGAWPTPGTSLIGPPGPSGGTFPDAPSDGSTYGRKNAAWAPVTSGIADAPNDGTLYGRKSQAWAAVPAAPPASIPSGSVMLFIQSAAPTGWTRVTTYDDALLRIVGSAAPGSGGTNGFVATFNAQTTTANFSIMATQIQAHNHSLPAGESNAYGPTNITSGGGIYSVQSTGSANTATGQTGGGGAHAHGITTAIKYVDAMIASKN